MKSFRFTYPNQQEKDWGFKEGLDLFLQLMSYTAGDVDEALDWMRQIDEEHKLFSERYTLDDFIEELKSKQFIQEDANGLSPSAKTGQAIRKNAFVDLFGKLSKDAQGQHTTPYSGSGFERTGYTKSFEFGDEWTEMDVQQSVRNAYINHGIDAFQLNEQDIEMYERELATQNSTVLMIDISHSMILYGEDRITPAKKVAMALSEYLKLYFPKDKLDIVVFGDDAWQIKSSDLPYLQVGPYHTNTLAGLNLALDLLRKKKGQNKQIIMITDGKPTCMKEGNEYYKNSTGFDPLIINPILNKASECKRLNIPITTFMIANDPYLKQFVSSFTEANGGKAYYTDIKNMGSFIMEDFIKNKKTKR
jgi:Ca-activated chloride channel homolog